MNIDPPLSREDLPASAITAAQSAGDDATTGPAATDSGEVRHRALTRRRFFGALAARAAFAGLAAAVGNLKLTVVRGGAAPTATAEPWGGLVPSHPDASSTTPAKLDPFLALSRALVGGGQLDEGRASLFLASVAEERTKQRALDELLASWAGKPLASRLSSPAIELRKEILEFWYLGTIGGRPVAGGGEAWATLHAWQAVRYTPAPSICKGYDSWGAPLAGTGAAGA